MTSRFRRNRYALKFYYVSSLDEYACGSTDSRETGSRFSNATTGERQIEIRSMEIRFFFLPPSLLVSINTNDQQLKMYQTTFNVYF